MCCPKFPTISYPKSYFDEFVDESGFSNQVRRRFANHDRARFSGFCIFFVAPSGYLSMAIQEYEGHSRRLVKILPDQ
ncbi:hypothetical protein HanHA300_Chr11g0402401 [Helianthus annuus]|nr:hypothetical protein HanHA300_Chr11g0402401 [Helianthus annuus]KAJ0517493.1 hypothetical protein HanHA89_Chr11g0425901 [Helianthus annuus]KAJ0685503.1 hypothetical protein HanLR1_Chr11g0403341 [Helianthus annuus]